MANPLSKREVIKFVSEQVYEELMKLADHDERTDERLRSGSNDSLPEASRA